MIFLFFGKFILTNIFLIFLSLKILQFHLFSMTFFYNIQAYSLYIILYIFFQALFTNYYKSWHIYVPALSFISSIFFLAFLLFLFLFLSFFKSFYLFYFFQALFFYLNTKLLYLSFYSLNHYSCCDHQNLDP